MQRVCSCLADNFKIFETLQYSVKNMDNGAAETLCQLDTEVSTGLWGAFMLFNVPAAKPASGVFPSTRLIPPSLHVSVLHQVFTHTHTHTFTGAHPGPWVIPPQWGTAD